jgi:hypothetical protein
MHPHRYAGTFRIGERDGGVKGRRVARWSREPEHERESERRKAVRGWKMPLDIFLSSEIFYKLRNDYIISDGDNTQLQLEKHNPPPPPPPSEEG